MDDELRCERECTRLCIDFAWAIDRREYPAFVALFAADGVFERPGQVNRGAAEIRKFLDARPADRITRHLCTNVRIDMTGSTSARGTCAALMYQTATSSGTTNAAATPTPTVVDYVDEYVLTADGWKFRHRKTTVVFEPRNAVR